MERVVGLVRAVLGRRRGDLHQPLGGGAAPRAEHHLAVGDQAEEGRRHRLEIRLGPVAEVDDGGGGGDAELALVRERVGRERKTLRRRSAEPSAFPKWEGPTDSPSATPGPSATLEVAAVMVTASPKGSPSVTREAVDAESSGLREVSHGRGPSENAGATE